MELRNLTRHFTYKHSLYKYNKQANYSLSNNQIAILFTVHYLCQFKPNVSSTATWLMLTKKLKMCRSWQQLHRDLNYLFDNGLLHIEKGEKFERNRYSITLEGIEQLQDFEQIHRNERLDK